MNFPTLSIVIPTYGREQVLLDTVAYLLEQAQKTEGFLELILVDQTPQHSPATQAQLEEWRAQRQIVWICWDEPHLTRAMNCGLSTARGDVVLFVDDDIIPAPLLLEKHLAAYRREPELWAVVGQVLQPGECAQPVPFRRRGGPLFRDLDFPFRTTQSAYIENVMAGNLSVLRSKALMMGGFDENFLPPVASRFETEFAKRLIEKGGRIRFEPDASIRHLRAATGGTRMHGSHLTSIMPCHGVGDYYYALRRGKGWEKYWYICRKPFREVRTKFHLKHPWWIPVKLVGELRAMRLAFKLARQKPKLLETAPSIATDAAGVHL